MENIIRSLAGLRGRPALFKEINNLKMRKEGFDDTFSMSDDWHRIFCPVRETGHNRRRKPGDRGPSSAPSNGTHRIRGQHGEPYACGAGTEADRGQGSQHRYSRHGEPRSV